MSTNFTQGQAAPHAIDPVYEVPDDAAIQVVTDSVSKSLLSSQIQDADRYNDKTRDILNQCIHLLPLQDKRLIEDRLTTIRSLEDKIESSISWFRKIFVIFEYQRVSKKTYYIVKRASNRVMSDQIIDRIRVPTHPQAHDAQQSQSTAPVPLAPIPTVAEPLSRTSNSIHPFRPRGRLPLDSATFHNVERVDVTTLQSRTGDSAVLLELHTREQRTQEFVATLQPIPPDDDTTDWEGEIGIPLNTYGPTEANSSDIWGPSSDITVDA